MVNSLFPLVAVGCSLLIAPLINLNGIYLVGALIEGWYALLSPTIKLLKNPAPEIAITLFNRASLYPLVMLTIVVISLYLPPLL